MRHHREAPRTALAIAALAGIVGLAACGAPRGSTTASDATAASASPSSSLGSAYAAPVAPATASSSPTVTPDRAPAAVVEGVPYAPTIDPAAFTMTIDNPYLPLIPGTTLIYEGDGERIEVAVTGRTRVVMGVETIAVRDRAYEEGALVEDTEDWFAQDAAGNVWYFGEDTAECEAGKPISTHGAWEAGVDGAQPGIVMLADPRVGDLYRQEFYAGEAEDQARVLRIDPSIDVSAGTFADVLVTEDFTPLEPDLLEEKSYARGVGVVQERTVTGGSGVLRLVETRTGQSPVEPGGAFDPCRE
jgi:hypothetical protein